MFILFIINIIIYFLTLKISYLFFGQKMLFPFRKAEISAIIITNSFAIFIFFNSQILLTILFINLLLSYSIYHLINMIQTSPRTKILLDLFEHKKIKFSDYSNIYNIENILDNRIKRFLTSDQIIIKDKKIYYEQNKTKFLKFLHFIFLIIKKI
tara:strand:+ start:1371 stop:1832 length:462 start_codon:yes stop_codon:yes gene_type:complete